MSGGTSAASIAVGAQAAGTVASTYGAYQKGKASIQADEYQAKVQENNAQLAKWRSEDAITRGQDAVAVQGLKVAALKSTQRASLASRGIDLSEGSALDILTSTDVMGKIDANTLADNAAKEAWGFRMQASNASSNADLLKMRASSTSPWGDAASSLLTGAGSVAKSWYDLKTRGAFGNYAPVEERTIK